MLHFRCKKKLFDIFSFKINLKNLAIMKKLIMLSIFALGTITASAGNDYFKNQYVQNLNDDPVFEIKYNKRHYVRQINIDANGGISETIIYDVTFCGTAEHHSYFGFITDEYYILNNTSGMPRFYNVENKGFCL